MKISWVVSRSDAQRVRKFVRKYKQDPFVKKRIERNVESAVGKISRQKIWQAMVACLITTQQRSGPGSAVTRFLLRKPFLLSYGACASAKNVEKFVSGVLKDFGGLRRGPTIGKELAHNIALLEGGLWGDTLRAVNGLREEKGPGKERKAADLVRERFRGFGPKQSRNLLQSLGVARYEIPIDSRITKWLNEFGFPVRLTASGLSDPEYYNFVADGIQAMCKAAGVFPCVLDAAIFTSFDQGQWTDKTVVW